jgi:hypothetical protein
MLEPELHRVTAPALTKRCGSLRLRNTEGKFTILNPTQKDDFLFQYQPNSINKKFTA